MSKVVRLPILIATLMASLALSSSAQAAIVTVGSPLLGVADPSNVNSNATIANITLEGPGAHATSPVSGAIVRWHLLASEGGPFALRVLRPAGSSSYTGAGTSSPVVSPGPGLQTFAAALPIQAGETIGADVAKGAKLGIIASTPLSSVAAWAPTLPEGATQPYLEAAAGAEFSFNAEVQPQPTVTAVSPPSGSFAGGSAVTIGGTDFASVSGVKFGANAATSYTVASEGEISAVAPPGAVGATDVTVTTLAGMSPVVAGDKFTYTAPAPTCIVPKLIGKKLKAAKKGLTKADCKLGRVTKLKAVTAKTGKVVKQSPKAGKVLAAGAKVSVKLDG